MAVESRFKERIKEQSSYLNNFVIDNEYPKWLFHIG